MTKFHITARHARAPDGSPVVRLQGLPFNNEELTASQLRDIARALVQHAIDSDRRAAEV